MNHSEILTLLGDKAEYLLDHKCTTIDKSMLHLPSPETVDRMRMDTDRNIPTLNNLQRLLGHGSPGQYGISFHTSRRPGYRTLRRGIICSESYLLRPRKHCPSGYRGWM